MPKPRSLLLRRLSSLLVTGGLVATSAACGSDPLIVTGRVDVAVSPDTTVVVDFPTATTLVRSPRAINTSVAGECTVERDFFSVIVSRDEASTGLRNVHISSDEASVDIGGVVYSGLEGVGCLIATRVSDPGYGTITFDVDCALDDGEGNTVSAVGALSFEGCH
ncbi:MAG: hypothetical protein IPG17_20515 [Sandaracinaceae bacterium]|jgi:hypothetical protein|nr:hypothetical protein [Sandaracinaceae bacterium]MBK7150410.1 hypothetical protein [Sandaracinaceae bacterium]MBK7777252.1 hypothetical protein [Sandaracinaceae bacterium]MBK8408752.1 hypothetical protein [Sandaracinaceae bacterium]MBK8591510.1 hypothetical protein [Sandaracinaceae bacterium]